MYLKNFSKSILNIGMAAALIVSLGIFLRSIFVYSIFGYYDPEDILTLSLTPLAMSSFIPFACIFPMMPYGLSYLEEVQSGYHRLIIGRMGAKRYIKNKIFFNTIAGGIASFVPLLIIFIIIDCVGVSVTAENIPEIFLEKIWGPYVTVWGGRLIFLMRLVLFFLFGCIWADIELLTSIITRNRYASFIIPFVVYQVGWMLLPSCVNPVALLRSDFASSYVPIWYPFAFQAFVLLILTVFLYWLMKREIENE